MSDRPDFKELTSGLAVSHLYRRYQQPEFFSVHEMQIGTHQRMDGRWQDRRADFVAVRLWGTGKSSALGFEIKTSRADFMKELQDPTKRQPLEELCSACYFVAPRGLFQKDELPEGWGWLELQKRGLRMQKEARHSPRAENTGFLHAIMKRMHDIRWYDRAKRPAVLDFPQRIWELEGRALTNGQLHALMLETFHAQAESLRAKAADEAIEKHRASLEKNYRSRLDRLEQIEGFLMEAIQESRWEVKNMDIAELGEHLRRATTGRASLDVGKILEEGIRDSERFTEGLKKKLATLAT